MIDEESLELEVADPDSVSDDDADRRLAGAQWRRLLVIGDSMAEGLGDPTPGYRTLPWPDRVARALERQSPDLAYRNLGTRYLRTDEIVSAQFGPGLEFHPDLALLVCGGNDLLARSFDPDAVEAQVDTMVAEFHAGGADVVLYSLMNIVAAVPQLASLESRIEALNQRMHRIATRRKTLFIDMWMHPSTGLPEMYSTDLMHPSMRGHNLLAAETIRALGTYLERKAH